MRSNICQSFALASLASFAVASSSSSPVVDLGYQKHQGNYIASGNYYNFSNIRYAAPPTGANRFNRPQPPAESRDFVHTGQKGRMCPQANPGWFSVLSDWIPSYQPGAKPNATKQQIAELAEFPESALAQLDVPDPRITEDCLFLDVLVPKKVMSAVSKKRSLRRRSGGVPVIVWIYGGGYTSGDKTAFDTGTSPAGLLKTAKAEGGDGVIFVAFNYRLGAFGWLSGSTVESDGLANVGLHDQRFALDWVKNNIHLFGGDADRITVMGESAGGGSIMHHITSHGGGGEPLPFQQAILQSPAFTPMTSENKSEQILAEFFKYANVSSLDDARKASSQTLMLANALQVARSMYGTYTFGPTVDGNYVPAAPAALLAEGKFHHDVGVMVSQNADEGLLFTNPTVQSNNGFSKLFQSLNPDINQTTLSEITGKLYPPNFDGSYGYTDQISRQAVALGELVVTCNTNYLDRAFENQTYSYLFAVPPALHSQDVPYTFYDGSKTVSGTLGPQQLDSAIATAIQTILTSFVQTGKAMYGTVNGTIALEKYGNNAQVLELNVTGIIETKDPADNPRCQFWQQYLSESSYF